MTVWNVFIDCRAHFVRCLGFPSRSALPLVWLRQYSLRASLPGLAPFSRVVRPEIRCLGFSSRSALPLVWLRQYSLRASLTGLIFFSLSSAARLASPVLTSSFAHRTSSFQSRRPSENPLAMTYIFRIRSPD